MKVRLIDKSWKNSTLDSPSQFALGRCDAGCSAIGTQSVAVKHSSENKNVQTNWSERLIWKRRHIACQPSFEIEMSVSISNEVMSIASFPRFGTRSALDITTPITKPFSKQQNRLPEVWELLSSNFKHVRQVEDKNGNAIEEGDTVFTKIRGGKREGEVKFPWSSTVTLR